MEGRGEGAKLGEVAGEEFRGLNQLSSAAPVRVDRRLEWPVTAAHKGMKGSRGMGGRRPLQSGGGVEVQRTMN